VRLFFFSDEFYHLVSHEHFDLTASILRCFSVGSTEKQRDSKTVDVVVYFPAGLFIDVTATAIIVSM
jgi:hypothetical protein